MTLMVAVTSLPSPRGDTLEVLSCCMKNLLVVLEEPEAAVAVGAEQPADTPATRPAAGTAGTIVIDLEQETVVLRLRLFTNGAHTVLRFNQQGVRLGREPIPRE